MSEIAFRKGPLTICTVLVIKVFNYIIERCIIDF